MDLTVRKLTDVGLMRQACRCTTGRDSLISLERIYRCQHSPMRTQLFWIELTIPTFVSVHLVRHKVGVEHFVRSNREDRGGDPEADRTTPVRHGMLANAEALVNMSRRRLCQQASPETRRTMEAIREGVREVDPDLAARMVPDCLYRNACYELRCCGRMTPGG